MTDFQQWIKGVYLDIKDQCRFDERYDTQAEDDTFADMFGIPDCGMNYPTRILSAIHCDQWGNLVEALEGLRIDHNICLERIFEEGRAPEEILI
ncbi:MAG: hypothetical protein ACRC5T_03995 [Cetobacterium sp.]